MILTPQVLHTTRAATGTCPAPGSRDKDFLDKLALSLTQGFFPDPSVTTPLDLATFNNATDTSDDTARQRATAMIQVLQSLSGTKGEGCPGASFPVLAALQMGEDPNIVPAAGAAAAGK